MPWGTIRQHSTGATWENSSSSLNHSRIFGFLPTFKHGLPNTTFSGTSHGDARRRTQTTNSIIQPPRGRHSQPAPIDVSRSQHPRTMQHSQSLSAHSSARPPRSIYDDDDPAFSTDPRSHPLFVITVPGDRSSRQLGSRAGSSSRSHSMRGVDDYLRHEYRAESRYEYDRNESSVYYAHHSRTEAYYPNDDPLHYDYPTSRTASGYSHSRSESVAYLEAPRGQPYAPSSSNHSLLTSESATTYASTSSSESHSSSSHHSYTSNSHSIPANQSSSTSIPFPSTQSNPSSKHSSRYEDSQPVINQASTSERPAEVRSVSVPDLRQRPPITPQAPRPVTAPLQDASNRPKAPRRENTRRHNPQRSGELDRIDELDETDPFGGVVHHGGPYEVINAVLNGPPIPSDNDGNGFNYPVRKQKSKKRVEPVIAQEVPAFDPTVSLNLVPGQILSRTTIANLQTLDPTPHQRKHRSHSDNPPPPAGILPSSHHQPPYPRYFPRESDLPPSHHHEPQERPEVQRDGYEDPYLTLPPPHPAPRPESRSHSRSHSHPPRRPISETRPQTPPNSDHKYQVHPQGPPQPLSQPQPQSLLLQPSPETESHPEPKSQHQSHSQSHPHSQPQPQPQPQPHFPPQSYHTQPSPESQRVIPEARSEESASQPHRHRQSHRQPWSSDRLPPSTSSISSRSTHYGPVPSHIPKHLVMPTPLQPTNPPQSQSQVHDYHGSHSTKASLQPRAEEISMLPDGRKLLRKRTMTHPGSATIPLRVALDEAPPSSVSSKGFFGILGSKVQESKNGPANTKEKGHRRLSKRKADI